MARGWVWIRWCVGMVVVAGLGWHLLSLARHPDAQLDNQVISWPHLLLCAGLYVIGMTAWGVYWALLVRAYQPDLLVRRLVGVYWISQVGKYIPGKAWVVVIRAGARRDCRVPFAVATMTSLYETLTTMACGAVLALPAAEQVFSASSGQNVRFRWLAIVMLIGLFALPRVLEALVRRFLRRGRAPLPPLRYRVFFVGLGLSAIGWLAYGYSALALLQALPPAALNVSTETGGQMTSWVALAYVGGFAALPAPAGLGVREAILQQEFALLLMPAAEAARAAILLRVVWTVADVCVAAAVWLWVVWRSYR